jgi:bifunctional DNA-binding transcriptional regulator/antitoxin component of YhaV-PrlF toxin-antitoxin module
MAGVVLQVKKWGSSLASVIPKKTAEELGLHEGDKIIAELRKKRGSGFGVWKGKNLPKFKREGAEHSWK